MDPIEANKADAVTERPKTADNATPEPHRVGSSAIVRPLSVAVESLRDEIVDIRSRFKKAIREGGFADRFECVAGLLTAGLITLHTINRDVIDHEIKCGDSERGPSVRFSPRGIGLDSCPECFVCGSQTRSAEAPTGLLNNISAFVSSKEDGERVVEWFHRGAWLDFRPSEPRRIQVKVGACDVHQQNLIHLRELTQLYCVIRERDIEDSVSWPNASDQSRAENDSARATD